MRVVVDTNVLLSALISPLGSPGRIYQLWRKGRFELMTSMVQLDELRRASRYPKLRAIVQPHVVGGMINNLHGAVVLESLPALPAHIRLGDENDAFLVAMAIGGDADYLVTGDHRAGLLPMGNVGRARILTPAALCEVLT